MNLSNKIFNLFLFMIIKNFQKTSCNVTTGCHNHYLVAKNLSAFVDKTNLIKEIFNYKNLLITAPDGFGKTTNLDMIKNFLHCCRKNETIFSAFLFVETSIWQDKHFLKDHFLKYPVIHLNFKSDLNFSDYESFFSIFKKKFHKLYKRHSYIQKSDKLKPTEKDDFDCYSNDEKYNQLQIYQVSEGLKFLIQSFYNYYENKVIVLIDDYDYLITKSIINNCSLTREIIEFHNLLFSNAFTNNKYLERYILTGVSTIPYRLGISSIILRDLTEISFCSEENFTRYYGFTELELDEILNRKELESMKETRNFLVSWYGGYADKKLNTSVLNMNAVIKFLETQYLNTTWVATDITENLNNVLEIPLIFKKFLILATGGDIEIEKKTVLEQSDIDKFKQIITHGKFESNETAYNYTNTMYFQLLFEKGYLTFCKDNETLSDTISVKLPNEQILKLLQQKLFDFIKSISKNKCEYYKIVKEVLLRHKVEGNNEFKNQIYRCMVQSGGGQENLNNVCS